MFATFFYVFLICIFSWNVFTSMVLCLSVFCIQDNSKSYKQTFINFWRVLVWPKKEMVRFQWRFGFY